ncbi:MAG: ATP-NAD kinase family protein [Gammaproteobacteria bacterium]|nr:ATP-NAD kinase family protein [Gammaproteobacteria bacterium]
MFRLGLIINPVAGIGGRVALKGSDGEDIQRLAMQRGAIPLAEQRMQQALQVLLEYKDDIHIYTAANTMGENLCKSLGFEVTVVKPINDTQTSAHDTEKTVQLCIDQGIDLLLFAGGDGTARNIFHALENKPTAPPVIGVPAGCKIHSSVYAVTPTHAGELLSLIVKGRGLVLTQASVMDIDEDEFRHDRVKAKLYGYLNVPAENQFMQNMKEGGITHKEITLQDIAAFIVETMNDDVLYLIGSGTTPKAILDELQLPYTLLGIDAVINHQLLASDVDEKQIQDLLNQHKNVRLIITIIGGQGHVFGRGNQQISPEVIRRIGLHNIVIISSSEKIKSLNGLPMRVDTGDEELNKALYGLVPVITGYDEKLLYRIG